jgi:hypothetical protein
MPEGRSQSANPPSSGGGALCGDPTAGRGELSQRQVEEE